jgi:hypothetical protein
MLGPKMKDFWPKIHHSKEIENTGSASLSKIGHDFKW